MFSTAGTTSVEVVLDGSLGGNRGCELAGGRAGGAALLCASRMLWCVGGGGRLAVLSPVRSARYGTLGTGLLADTSSSGSTSGVLAPAIWDCVSGAPNPPRCGVISFGSAAPP